GVDRTFISLPLGTLLAAAATRLAWNRALERRSMPIRLTRRMHPLLVVASVYFLRLVRAARARLAVGALGIGTGFAALALSLRNDPPPRPVQRAAIVLAMPFAIAAAAFVRPMLDTERSLHPFLRSTRTPAWVAVAAFILAVVTPTSAFGCVAAGAM